MTDLFVFLDGEMVTANPELLKSLLPGVIRGEGVFETMRVYNGRIFALEEHFHRMDRGLRLMGIRSPYSQQALTDCLYQTLWANSLDDARVRLAVWTELGQRRIAIVCQSLEPGWYEKNHKGWRAMISSVQTEKSKYSNIKSLNYLYFRKAFLEATQKGFDEAILVNSQGSVVEGSRTNIFYVKDGCLYTPPVECGCLNGVTRQLTLKIAARLGIPQKIIEANTLDLSSADEVFVTNSLIGLVHVRSIDGKGIAQGHMGPVTQKCRDAYNTIVHSSCPASRNSV